MNEKYTMVVCVLTCAIFASCITENNYNMGFGGTSEEDPGFGGSISNGVSGYETNGVGEGGSSTNSTSSTNSVTSSSSGEPVCIPGTCEEIGAECGQIFDGCGNYISCESGTCTHRNGYSKCGTERFENGASVGKNPNLCGGGCKYMDKYHAPVDCETTFPHTNYDNYFWCVPNGIQAIETFGDCEWAGSRPDSTGFGGDWCCQRAPE